MTVKFIAESLLFGYELFCLPNPDESFFYLQKKWKWRPSKGMPKALFYIERGGNGSPDYGQSFSFVKMSFPQDYVQTVDITAAFFQQERSPSDAK